MQVHSNLLTLQHYELRIKHSKRPPSINFSLMMRSAIDFEFSQNTRSYIPTHVFHYASMVLIEKKQCNQLNAKVS